jgi:hypoxanthine phosphoribosyltransferase
MVDVPKNIEKLHYSWEQFDADVEKIARAVESSGRKFTHIYGLPRGGLALAVCLSHRLNLTFAHKAVDGSDPEWQFVGSKLEEIIYGLYVVDRANPKKVLVVDDLSDTGAQLEPFRKRGLFIATIHKKPWTKVTPEIWLGETTSWVVYPWEKDPLR